MINPKSTFGSFFLNTEHRKCDVGFKWSDAELGMPNLRKKITCLLNSLHSSVLSNIPFLFLIYSDFLFLQPERTLPRFVLSIYHWILTWVPWVIWCLCPQDTISDGITVHVDLTELLFEC